MRRWHAFRAGNLLRRLQSAIIATLLFNGISCLFQLSVQLLGPGDVSLFATGLDTATIDTALDTDYIDTATIDRPTVTRYSN